VLVITALLAATGSLSKNKSYEEDRLQDGDAYVVPDLRTEILSTVRMGGE
jgi:hypothetical protein